MKKIIFIIVLSIIVTIGCTPKSSVNIHVVPDLTAVEESVESDFFGEWKIKGIAAVSLHLPDDDAIAYLVEDYIGYTIKYSQDAYCLGDKKVANPSYELCKMVTYNNFVTGAKINNELSFFALFQEHGFNVNVPIMESSWAGIEWPLYEIPLTDEQMYEEQMGAGAQFTVVNENFLLLGVWGVILYAERVHPVNPQPVSAEAPIFLGKWQIVGIAATYKTMANINDASHPEGYIGCTIVYHKDSYSLDDQTFVNARYVKYQRVSYPNFVSGHTIIDDELSFRTLLIEHGVDLDSEWMRYEIPFMDERGLEIESGIESSVTVLNDNFILLGIYDVILYAERIEEIST